MRETIWESMPLHGQHKKLTSQPHVDELSWTWLSSSGLKPASEGFIFAAQDQSLPTKYYRKRILKQNTDGKCRMCHNQNETVAHLMSGCGALAATEYTWRHNRIGHYIHLELCKHFNITTSTKNWYDYSPAPVTENEQVKIL